VSKVVQKSHTAMAGAAVALLLSGLLSSCPFYPIGDSVVFSDPGPGATIVYRDSIARYGVAYPVSEESTVAFDWTVRLDDRYRWLYCAVSPEAELEQSVTASASGGTASFVKNAYVMTVHVVVREYTNSLLLASADGQALAWIRNDAVTGDPGSFRLLTPTLLAADSSHWEERLLRPADGSFFQPVAWTADGRLIIRVEEAHYAIDGQNGAAELIGLADDAFSAVSPDGRYFASTALAWFDSQENRRASLQAPGDQVASVLAVSADTVVGTMSGTTESDIFIWRPAESRALKLATVPCGSITGAVIVPSGSAQAPGDVVVVLASGELRLYPSSGGSPSVTQLDTRLSARRIAVRGVQLYVEAQGSTEGIPYSVLHTVHIVSGELVLDARYRVDWGEQIEPVQDGWAYLANPYTSTSRLYRDVVITAAETGPTIITPDDAAMLED